MTCDTVISSCGKKWQ